MELKARDHFIVAELNKTELTAVIYVITRSTDDYTSVNELLSTIHRVVTHLFHDQ